MANLSKQTKSFILLTFACIFGAFLVVLISSQTLKNTLTDFEPNRLPNDDEKKLQQNLIPTALASDGELVIPDTSLWPVYKDLTYGISFKLPPEWKVKASKKEGNYDVIEIDPGQKFYNIKIYISKKDYFVMDGLPAIKMTIGGATALNVSNLLYGINANGYYYTFDIGPSLSLTPNFNGMVRSVEFIR